MEKLNLDFTDYFSVSKSLLWILSIFSWLFFICTGWASIKIFHQEEYEIIWTIKKIGKSGYTKDDYNPIHINTVMLYIIFMITMLFAVAGFVIYIIKSTCKKEDNIFEGMMGIWSRLHSFPLILVSFLFLLGEYFYPYYNDIYLKKDYSKYFNHMRDIHFFALFFSLIALISLIFIYIVTDLKTDCWYAVLTIKKGTYSCLIILLWYYFWYMVYQVNEYIYPTMTRHTTLKNLRRKMGISFSVIIGFGSLVFAFFFKDIVASFMNLLIYIGMCIHFFMISIDTRSDYENEWADGIIDVIIIASSMTMIAFLIIKYRKECLKSSIFED